jgi:hypothetical protein
MREWYAGTDSVSKRRKQPDETVLGTNHRVDGNKIGARRQYLGYTTNSSDTAIYQSVREEQ